MNRETLEAMSDDYLRMMTAEKQKQEEEQIGKYVNELRGRVEHHLRNPEKFVETACHGKYDMVVMYGHNVDNCRLIEKAINRLDNFQNFTYHYQNRYGHWEIGHPYCEVRMKWKTKKNE